MKKLVFSLLLISLMAQAMEVVVDEEAQLLPAGQENEVAEEKPQNEKMILFCTRLATHLNLYLENYANWALENPDVRIGIPAVIGSLGAGVCLFFIIESFIQPFD